MLDRLRRYLSQYTRIVLQGASVDTDAVIDLAVQDIAKDQETMAESVQAKALSFRSILILLPGSVDKLQKITVNPSII